MASRSVKFMYDEYYYGARNLIDESVLLEKTPKSVHASGYVK